MGLDPVAAFGLLVGALEQTVVQVPWELMWHSVNGQAEVGSLPHFLTLL